MGAQEPDFVKDARERDFFFWDRFSRRTDRATEYPQPEEWYTPNTLVEGDVAAPFAAAPAGKSGISGKAWQEVRDWAIAKNSKALIVLIDGKIHRQHWAEGHWPGQVVPVRSMAKTLPALLIGKAIEEDKIGSVDDQLSKYLPEWADDARGKITLSQLLNMASGLVTIPTRYEPENLQIRLAEGANVSAVALSWPIAGEADKKWTINQVDTQLLALVIERATNERYQDYLSRVLWRPIGAGTATLNVDNTDRTVRAYCCMRTGLFDWLRIGELLRNKGKANDRQIISAAWIAEMLRPSPANRYMGRHIWLGWKPGTQEDKGGSFLQVPHKEPYRVDDVSYLLGGSMMSVWVIPSHKMTVLRWGDDPTDWDHSYIVNRLIDDLAANPKGKTL